MPEFGSTGPITFKCERHPANWDLFRDSYVAQTAIHKPNNGEDPWPAPTSHAERIAPVIKFDASNSAETGGDIPFLDANNPKILNNILGNQPEKPSHKRMHFSFLNRIENGAYAVAVISPEGGFDQQDIRRFGLNMMMSSTSGYLPPSVPVLGASTKERPLRSLYVGTFGDPRLKTHEHEQQSQLRGLLGAMVTYHALQQVPAETNIQYAFLKDRLGCNYRRELTHAMGLEPYDVATENKFLNRYTFAEGRVGHINEPDTVLHSLATRIQLSHSITEQ